MPWPRQKARQSLTERYTRGAHFAGGKPVLTAGGGRRQVRTNNVNASVVIIVAIWFAGTGFAGVRDRALCVEQGRKVSPARLHGRESQSSRSSRAYTDSTKRSVCSRAVPSDSSCVRFIARTAAQPATARIWPMFRAAGHVVLMLIEAFDQAQSQPQAC
jgi:hypothetical protein